jgi:multiple sugar transport system permease protein
VADSVGVNGIGRRRTAASAAPSSWADRHIAWLLAAPAVLLILALSIYPLLYSVWVAFVNYDFEIPGHAFVGLQNFRDVIGDPIARRSLVNTAVLAAASVAVEFVLGLLLALAMADHFRGRGVIMSILIVPLFISPVIVGQFWSLLLQQPYGPTNYLLGKLLGEPVAISWMTQPPWNFFAIITADVWQWTPFMFVILLAGLTAIPAEIFEAAELDGATRWQTLVHVTLPLLTPIILLALTFRLLDAIKLFDIIYVMTGGGPGSSTYTASFYLYQIGFQQFHLAKATAGSWLFLILSAAIIMLLVRRLLRPEVR